VADAQAKAEALTRESETNAAALERESQETAHRVTREAEEKAEMLTRESTQTADRVTREAQEKANALVAESEKKASAAVSESETKADNIMRNAHERADRIMADTKASVGALIAETESDTQAHIVESNKQIGVLTDVIRQLMAGYEDYKNKFETLLQQQLEQLQDNKYQVDIAGLEELLESEQVKIAQEQASAQQQIQDITAHTGELDLPVEDTAPAGFVSSLESEPEKDILAGGLSSDISEEDSPKEASAAVSSLNIDTPSSDEIASAQGIDVAEEEAVAYKPSFETETSDEPEVPEDIKSKLSEIDAIAAEALKDTAMPHETFDPNNTMLGTSYDDFVPAKEQQAQVVEEPADFAKTETENTPDVSEVPPITTDTIPTVQEAYNAENYITSETYFGSADNMTYSIPDPQEASQNGASREIEAHSIPMPDFSKLDVSAEPEASTSDSEVSTADLDALAETAAAALNEIKATAPGSVQEEYDAETYVTNETYFGSADNIPYTGAVSRETGGVTDSDVVTTQPSSMAIEQESVADEFAAGISGMDPTVGGMIPPAPDELFTAPNEFDSAPPADDEYAVSGSGVQQAETQDAPKVTPFTFIDADK
jgi:hypothetical protein